MNNNYHTQMNKQNLLNEIAANNHLLQQQQMQNFQGTHITSVGVGNKTISNQNLLSQQMPPIQYYPNQMYSNSTQSYSVNLPSKNDEEFELSENKTETKYKEPLEVDNNNKCSNIQPRLDIEITKNENNINKRVKKHAPIKYNPRRSVWIESNTKKENNMIDYIIIPILLILIFVILVHTSTNKYLERYLPEMNSLKGYVVRGTILAFLYVIVRLISGMMSKTKN
jgi:hypothetical protein